MTTAIVTAADWCPSTALERKAVDAGESIDIAIVWAWRAAKVALFGLGVYAIGRVMGWL